MTQIIPFIKESRRLFLSGTPFWSANSFFGADYLGTYSYYVYASPFFWPLLLLNENQLEVGITVIFIMKHMLAGVSSYLFLSTQFEEKRYAVSGSLIYTFSSFTFDATYYFIFLDVIAVFPLFLYFLEKALYGNGDIGFIFAVFLNATINYYCFIGTSIFFLIYLFIRVKNSDELNWKCAIKCIALYAAGVAASAVILLPAAFSLLNTSKATGSFSKIFISAAACIPQIFKLIRSIVLPSEGILGSGTGFTYSTFCSNAGFIPFFGAIFSLIALRQNDKDWSAKLLKILLIVTIVPFGNGIFTLFSNLNYTRWWYCLVMMMVLASLKALQSFENKEDELILSYGKSAKTIAKIAISFTLSLVIVKIIFAYFVTGLMSEKLSSGALSSIANSGLTDKFTSDDLRYFAALVIMTAATYIPLHIFVKRKQIFNFKKVIPVIAVICAISYLCYLSTDSNVFFADEISSPHIVDNSLTEETKYDSRTDFKVSLNNYSMVVNQPSINTFSSFKSKATSEFSRLAGFDSHSITKKHFSTEAIQTVLSISKVVEKDKTSHEAEYYCPFGYVYNYYVIDKDFEATSDKKENDKRIELMCKACIIDESTAKELGDIVSPLSDDISWKEASKKDKESACTEFTMTSAGFTAKSVGDHERLVYFSIPNDKGWKITVNGNDTKIHTINGGMIGIVVPEGESLIVASFYPPMLNAGLSISCISVFAIAVYSIVRKKRKSKYSSDNKNQTV